jgi:hypothetical protein
MAGAARTAARFPAVHASRGHYESFYLKACHPSEPVAVWIRHTVHKRPGAGATAALWFTLFDSRAPGPWAVKQAVPEPATRDGAYITIGEAALLPGRARGRAEGRGRTATWDLSFESAAEPLHHLPREWMYRAPLPRTKLLSPYPDARFQGRLAFDGEEVAVEGWRGMVGHNWGSQHAERWIWIHAAGFDGDGGGWIDAGLGRVRLGRLTTPWIANGAISLDGERLRLGGVERTAVTEVREAPDECVLVLPGRDLTVQVLVKAARKDLVGWLYADPDGSSHEVVNCSVSDLTLTVSRPGRPPRTLEARASAAYELGMRESGHGVQIQPYADGSTAFTA